jgi:TonB family protein
VRIVEASPAPTRSRRSGWRVGAPVAVVVLIVLIAALLLGRQLLSHKPEPAAPPTIATTETKPAAAAAPEPSPPEDPIRHRIVPEISANTKRKIHGVIKVSVHVDVDQSGKVIAANIVSPSSSQYFNNLSQETAEQWEFSPAENNGTPVQSAWLLRFQFSRRSTQVVPSRIAHP